MSTLNPGKPSKAIRDLREAALREMDKPSAGEEKAEVPNFDTDHSKSPEPAHFNPDTDNGVARYPGQNSPHVGNGAGGLR